MVLREENSGLIDLDALLREAAARAAVAADEGGLQETTCAPTDCGPPAPADLPSAPLGRRRTHLAIPALMVATIAVTTGLVLSRSAPIANAATAAALADKLSTRESPRAAVAPTIASAQRTELGLPATAEDGPANTPASSPSPARPRATGAVAPARPADRLSPEATSTAPLPAPSIAPANDEAAASSPTETAAPAASASATGESSSTPEAAPPAAVGGLEDAMRAAVGARNPAGTEANAPPTGPHRPSLGAVAGALRSVLPAARACLDPNGAVRNGLVVFASDGTVSRVELMGSEAEDDCIRSALAKAKLPPFLEETFSTRVTVRR